MDFGKDGCAAIVRRGRSSAFVDKRRKALSTELDLRDHDECPVNRVKMLGGDAPADFLSVLGVFCLKRPPTLGAGKLVRLVAL